MLRGMSRLVHSQIAQSDDMTDTGPLKSWDIQDVLEFVDACPHYGAFADVGLSPVWMKVTCIREDTRSLYFLHDGDIRMAHHDSYGKPVEESSVGPNPEDWWSALGIERVDRSS